MSLADENKEFNGVEENIVDLNIDSAKRTKFRINGDNDAIIELNLSDFNIVSRLKEGLERLSKATHRIAEANNTEESDSLTEILKEADKEMRECVDYIFDYPVSAVVAKYGSMYDPKDGKLRFESVIDTLTSLYADNIKEEYQKLQNRISKYTDKYITSAGKGKKKKNG